MSQKKLSVKLNEIFIIELPKTTGTGYKWIINIDEEYLKLIEKNSHLLNSKPGAKSIEVFEFLPFKKGTTMIELTYKRAWQESFAEKFIYEVSIS